MLARTRAFILTMALLPLAVANADAQTPPPRPDFAAAPGWFFIPAAKCWAHFPDAVKNIEPLFSGWNGKCQDQKITGPGILTNAFDLSITGTFENGELKGTGKVSWGNGMITYDGTFSDGALRGTGTGTWADGSKYQGGFLDDKFEGQGRWDVSSTVYYEGPFKANVMYGQGKLTSPYGTIEGEFNGWTLASVVTFTQPGQAPITGPLTAPVNITTSPIVPPAWPPELRRDLIAVAHFIVMPDGTPADVTAYTTLPGKTGVQETLRLDLIKAVQAARFTPGKIGDTIVPMPAEFAVAYTR